ncbi:hypothetical protein [Streptomyces sp. NPDC005890]|uniref:hypothetical protein n=1 Tax=Streptomyces sp. NPDC005890 TaxID=3154568 RepID=UPI0033C7B1CF
MNHAKRAILALTVTAAALTIAAPAYAAEHAVEPPRATTAAQPVPPGAAAEAEAPGEEPIDAGFVGTVLGHLLGTSPETE